MADDGHPVFFEYDSGNSAALALAGTNLHERGMSLGDAFTMKGLAMIASVLNS
jgi:hypothetical protein